LDFNLISFASFSVMFTTGFKFNFEFLCFWGPIAPFKNCYQLRPEYKVNSKREELSNELSKWIVILGLCNLVLSPFILIWQLLQFFYNYTELIKRDPGVLGTRRWSNYGKLYFRHFNELDHELNARLSRAYRPATTYVNSFVSKFLVIVAKFIVLTFGAVFAVLVVLTVIDEDVLNVEHVFTIISISGALAGIGRSLIPSDEQAIFLLEQLIYQILAQVHYMPDAWKASPHSLHVRAEFVKIFQYKFVYLIEELLSPITTPFILIFWLRKRSHDIIDFFRNFTIDVVGVGDVCSFSQLDTQKHGNPKWLSDTKAKAKFQARNGKTELSLIHFNHTNPQWKMPKESAAFIGKIKEYAEGEMEKSISEQGTDTSLTKSLYHLQSLPVNTALSSNILKSNINNQLTNTLGNVSVMLSRAPPAVESMMQARGGISKLEGPLLTTKGEKQTLLSIAQASTLQISGHASLALPPVTITNTIENNLDMSFSALYMHELHRKYHHGDYIDLDSVHEESTRDNDLEMDEPESEYPLSNRNLLV